MSVVNDLIFSFNIVLPVFIIILVGFYMRRRGTIGQSFIDTVSNVVFYYALPVGLFLDCAMTDPQELVNPRFVIVTMAGTTILFVLSWLVLARLSKDGRAVAAAVHSSVRGNYIYVGVPIIQNILQRTNLTSSILVITFVLTWYNVLAVIVHSAYSQDKKALRPGRMLRTLIGNPMIISTFLGIVYALTPLPMPGIAETSLNYLKGIASPLALIMIGASMASGTKKTEGRLEWGGLSSSS